MWLLVVFDDIGEAHYPSKVTSSQPEQPWRYVGLPGAEAVKMGDEDTHCHRDGSQDHDHHQVYSWNTERTRGYANGQLYWVQGLNTLQSTLPILMDI